MNEQDHGRPEDERVRTSSLMQETGDVLIGWRRKYTGVAADGEELDECQKEAGKLLAACVKLRHLLSPQTF